GKEVFDIVVKKGYLEVKPLSEKGKKLIAKLSSLKKENAKKDT
ncbi:MAG: coenzyme F420 hydrogenase subunit beta, partial [Thermoprotei archaeon]